MRLLVRPVNQFISEHCQPSVHPPKVAQVAILHRKMRVAEIQYRLHPLLLFIVLNHGLHRFVLRHHGANVAAESAVTAARCGCVDHDRTLRVWCRAAIDAEELLVVDPPRIGLRDEVLPDVIARP